MAENSAIKWTPDRLVNMLVDMTEVSAAEFNARYPDYLIRREDEIRAGWMGWDASLRTVLAIAREVKDAAPAPFAMEVGE